MPGDGAGGALADVLLANSTRQSPTIDASLEHKHTAAVPLMPGGSNYILFADSPFGPWRNGSLAPNPGYNSVPLFFPNGSLLVARQGTTPNGPTGCPKGVPGACFNGSSFLNWVYAGSVADLEAGNFTTYGPHNITVSPWTHWEDVFMWRDSDGHFHALFHAVYEHWENSSFSQADLGGHAFSEDGFTWHAAEWNAYGHVVEYAGGETWVMAERERPHLIFDKVGEPIILLNGVSPYQPYQHINDHSFTQAAPLRRGTRHQDDAGTAMHASHGQAGV
jgi:hypothetical protein